jgi:hypothetical protein
VFNKTHQTKTLNLPSPKERSPLRAAFLNDPKFEGCPVSFNPLNAELNPICHLLALLGAHRILHVSRIRVNYRTPGWATHLADLQATWQKQPWNGTLKNPDHEAVPEQHGAEQSSKRSGIKAKHGMKSKY